MCVCGWEGNRELAEKVAFEVSFEKEVRFVFPCFESYLGNNFLNKKYSRHKGLSAQVIAEFKKKVN